jgi:hypothetical protein
MIRKPLPKIEASGVAVALSRVARFEVASLSWERGWW